MSLHLKIVEARRNKGLTQEEVADRANVTVRTIQRIESGETIPRNFTLKAIAQVLGIPFEELLTKENHSSHISRESEAEEVIHFLKLLNLSSFTYLLLPYIHFLVPMYILRRRKEQNIKIVFIGRKIIQGQIIWVIAMIFIMLLTVAYNLVFVYRFGFPGEKAYIHYLWPAMAMYFLNGVIIIMTHFRIRSRVAE